MGRKGDYGVFNVVEQIIFRGEIVELVMVKCGTWAVLAVGGMDG